ncbi:MAG: tetratricopeptide repeat protein, partial [Deltaproteobacteria bacterium]|nr:tetratricopeptide repeat protein [Deltaproteobacteria bacterium]
KALIGTFIAAQVLIVALIIWRLQPGELSLPKTPVEKAYALLRAGDLGAAERQFEMLSQTSGPDSLRGYEGLASVSFHRGDYQTADGLCRKVVDADPETIYARVILGNIAFNQGDLDAALKAYETASQGKHGSPWQKAEAYNRLGRIYMERQKPESAFSSFDEALTLDPQNATVLSNKGTLLATLGKRDDAASLYRKALALSPSDSLTMTLLNQLLAEEKSDADKAQKERIDRLVVELSERFRNQSQESKPAYATDTWTSRPLSVSFLALENRGAISLRAAENDYLVYTIIKSLQNKERISIIERELIDKLLQELNLSSSDLADPTTSIKLGKIVGARFIATGKVTRLGTELQVTLRVIETETTSVMGAFSEIVAQTVDLETAATMLADKISETLVTRFPLHAKIAAVDGDRVILNIGARAGAAVGVRMTVFQNGEPIIIDGRQIGNQKEEIGEIEIISVEEEMSTASAVTKNKDFTKDQRAVEIQPPSEGILETAV